MDDFEYTPEILKRFEQQIGDLYHDILCVDEAGVDPESTQFYLLALASLEMARRYMDLARFKQVAALAQSGGK